MNKLLAFIFRPTWTCLTFWTLLCGAIYFWIRPKPVYYGLTWMALAAFNYWRIFIR